MSPDHLIQVLSLSDDKSPAEAPSSDGEHSRQDDVPPAEGQVQSSAGGVIVQMEPDHQQKQRNGIDEVLADTVAVNEASASKESARLDLDKGDEVRPHSADNLSSKPSTNTPPPSANRNYSSSAEINIVSSNKQQNLRDTSSVDLGPSPYPLKDVNNSPKDLVNRCPPLNDTQSSQTKSNDTKTTSPITGQKNPSDEHPMHQSQPSEQPLEHPSGEDQVQFKSENRPNAQGKRQPQQIQRLSKTLDAKNDANRPLSGSLSTKPAEGSSLVKPLQISDADNIKMKEESEVVFSRSTESGENTEQKENVGNGNKKKRKKKKSKHSKKRMDNTIQDDSSSSVSDCSNNSAVNIQHKEGKQQTKLKAIVQNQPNSAETDTVTVTNKRVSTKKRKRHVAKKHDDDDSSLSCANILGRHDGFVGVTHETVLSTTPDTQRRASQSSDTSLQKQNFAMKTGKTADKIAVNKCREYGDKNKNVAEVNIDRNNLETYNRNEDVDDKCKRKDFAPKLNINLQKHDKQTCHHSGNSETTNKSRDELKHMEMKVNKRSSQNQNGCPYQAQEALRYRHNLTSKDQQRI